MCENFLLLLGGLEVGIAIALEEEDAFSPLSRAMRDFSACAISWSTFRLEA
jgi:hypothetical protein